MKILAIALCVILFAWGSQAQGKPPNNKGGKPDKEQHKKKNEREDQKDLESGIELVSSLISVDEARKIARQNGAGGQKPLPPGIRKNLAKGKPMPPGIQKSRMPGGMLDQLPKRNGYEWRGAGTDLVLVQSGTEVVADVLKDVFD